jgi:hypothetical protein
MRQRPPRPLMALVGVALLATAACSGNDDTAKTDLTTTTVVTMPDTGPSTSFNVPQVTAETRPPTTTAPADTTPSTSTTVPPAPGSTEEAVAAAAVEVTNAYRYAVSNLGAPDALDRLIAVTTEQGTARQVGVANYESLVANGWLSKPNPTITNSSIVESVTIIDAVTAEVVTCDINASIVYAPGGNPDGSDLIINDAIRTSRERSTFVLEAGTWKLVGGERIERWDGAISCPPG